MSVTKRLHQRMAGVSLMTRTRTSTSSDRDMSDLLERAIGYEAGSPALFTQSTRRNIIGMLVASAAIPVPREDVLADNAGVPIPAGAPPPQMRASGEVKELAKYSDLTALGWSWDWIASGFQKEFGKRPDYVHMNGERSGGKKSITEEYGYYFYKWWGERKYTSRAQSDPRGRTIGSQWAYNYGNEEATSTLTVSGTFTESVSISTKSKYGIKLKTKVSILGQEIEVEGSYEYEEGETTTSTQSYSISSSVQVRVPPRSKRKVELISYYSQGSYTFEQPIRMGGYFGAQFSPRVRGHFYWFLDGRYCLGLTSNRSKLEDVLTGEVKTSFEASSKATIGEAIPL
jgi:hypothetical protein